MGMPDEIRKLREEIRAVQRKVDEISARIGRLEKSAAPVEGGKVRLAEADAAPAARSGAVVPPPPRPRVEATPPAPPRETPPPPGPHDVAAALRKEVPARVESLFKRDADAGDKAAEKQSWEMALGTKWIPRIGIFLITLAVFYFLRKAFLLWGPGFRIGLGYAVCFTLLGLGRFFEKKRRDYARVLYSGGIALSYFVTFATHYIPQTRIFPHALPALVLMAGVVLFWSVITQMRKSGVLGFLVTLLAHLTLFLFLHAGGEISRNSVVGVVLVSLGAAFFLLRNGWYYLASVGIAGSYFNYMYWLYRQPGSDRLEDLLVALAFLSANFLVFALAELFSPEALRRGRIPTWFRTAFVTLNTACYFSIATLMIHTFEQTRDNQDVFRLIYAGVLILIALAYLRVRAGDPMHNVYMTKGVAVATLGLAARYSGDALSAWLAVEVVVLLISARRSGLLVTRALAGCVAVIALMHALGTQVDMGRVAYDAPEHTSRLFRASLTAVAFWVASQVYQRTDWSIRAPKRLPLKDSDLAILWRLDMVSERPSGAETIQKPLEGLLFPYLYALAGLAIALVSVFTLAEQGHYFATLAGLGLALTIAGGLLSSQPFGLAAMLLAAIATAVCAGEFALDKLDDARVAAVGLLALGGAALASEESIFGARAGLRHHQQAQAPYVLYALCAFALALTLSNMLGGGERVAWLAVASAGAGGLFLILHPRALSSCATGLAVWTALVWCEQQSGGGAWHAGAWTVVALLVGGERFFAIFRQRGPAGRLRPFLLGAAWLLLFTRYIPEWAPEDWLGFWWAVLAFAFFGHGLITRAKTGAILGVWSALLASALFTIGTRLEPHTSSSLVAGFGALAIFWFALETLSRQATGDLRARLDTNQAAGILVTLFTAMLVIMLARLPFLSTYLLTVSWVTLGAALFAVALAVRQKLYRYAALTVLFLALARLLFIDIRGLPTNYKVIAAGFSGVVFLAIAYGYLKARERQRSLEKSREGAGAPEQETPARGDNAEK